LRGAPPTAARHTTLTTDTGARHWYRGDAAQVGAPGEIDGGRESAARSWRLVEALRVDLQPAERLHRPVQRPHGHERDRCAFSHRPCLTAVRRVLAPCTGADHAAGQVIGTEPGTSASRHWRAFSDAIAHGVRAGRRSYAAFRVSRSRSGRGLENGASRAAVRGCAAARRTTKPPRSSSYLLAVKYGPSSGRMVRYALRSRFMASTACFSSG
jgi:hypothetical protein